MSFVSSFTETRQKIKKKLFFGIYVLENPHDQKIRKIYCLTKIAFYTLKLTFFKKFDSKFEIYGLKNPYGQKMRKIYHQINALRIAVLLNIRFYSFSKEKAVLKINRFLKMELVPEK